VRTAPDLHETRSRAATGGRSMFGGLERGSHGGARQSGLGERPTALEHRFHTGAVDFSVGVERQLVFDRPEPGTLRGAQPLARRTATPLLCSTALRSGAALRPRRRRLSHLARGQARLSATHQRWGTQAGARRPHRTPSSVPPSRPSAGPKPRRPLPAHQPNELETKATALPRC
jgi:hypothetical protein